MKRGRIRRRGKMAPRLEFCLAEEQKAPPSFSIRPALFNSTPRFSIRPAESTYSRQIRNSAPALSPKLFSSLMLKQNEIILLWKKEPEHQGPCYGKEKASILLPIRAWEAMEILLSDKGGRPPPPPPLSKSAKYHQTDNTSVLEEQTQEDNEVDHDVSK